MDRATHLVRRCVAFAAAGCALLAVVLLRSGQSAPVSSNEDLPYVFDKFEPGKAKGLELSHTVKKDGKDEVERIRLVEGSADAWAIETSHGYPAATARVKAFLDGLRGLRQKGVPTENPEKFPQFAGEGGFTEVKVTGEAGATLASFGIG